MQMENDVSNVKALWGPSDKKCFSLENLKK
jgi:hypothetical protein